MKASHDPNAPYENIAEGEDLGRNFERMQLFVHGFNRAGFAYRGDHQNSNTFAGAALLAGKLPPATGVAHDPAGLPASYWSFLRRGNIRDALALYNARKASRGWDRSAL